MGPLVQRWRNLTIGSGLKLVLVAQAFAAAFLLIADIGGRWSASSFPSDGRDVGPVREGEQVLPYDLRRSVPLLVNPDLMLEVDVPRTIPSRLAFSAFETDEFGPLVLINGQIRPDDAQRFEAYIAGLSEPPRAVALNSPGGIVDEALAIGRLLRAMEFDTLVLPGMICLSSCPYALAGGIERTVSLQGIVGLHQHYYEVPRYLPVYFAVEDIQQNQGRTMVHLIEMGVDPGLMVYSLATPPDEIYVLVEEELMASRLATRLLDLVED